MGSHARGAARQDSDVDLMLVTRTPGLYVEDTAWVESFGTVRTTGVEDWGAVTSVRAHYAEGREVEFGVTSPSWAATDPVDPGTAAVVRHGFRVLVDPTGLLQALLEAAR